MDTFTEVTRRGLFGRLGQSVKGLVFGAVLFLASFPVLFINEGCAVKDHKRLAEAREAAVELTSPVVLTENEGRLVVTSGEATTDEEVRDPYFQVQVAALRLERRAEMYQWKEETSTKKRKNVGGSETRETEYRYKKAWSQSLISSSNFKRSQGHENPTSMPVKSADFQAEVIQLGEFRLPAELARKISDDQDIVLTEEDFAKLSEEDRARFKLHDGGLYLGSNPDSPAIGDVRVRFEQVKPTVVTVRSEQQGSSFAPWMSSNGGEVHEIRMGALSADQMNEKAVTAAKFRTWAVRLGGFLIMGMGLATIVGPLAVLGDVIPFVGSLVRGASGVVAFALAGVLSLSVIAIAWFTYRPMLSIPLLVVAGALTWWVASRGKGEAAAGPPAVESDGTPPPMNF